VDFQRPTLIEFRRKKTGIAPLVTRSRTMRAYPKMPTSTAESIVGSAPKSTSGAKPTRLSTVIVTEARCGAS
jgi:hypothetical protein